jgi:transcriptional regulator NrdR family protein
VIFTTHEAIDFTKALAVKGAGGALKPFMKEKLFLSIFKSCQHRQTTLEDAIALTNTAITQMTQVATDGWVSNRHVAAACLSVLGNFDKAAVVQYEAYHVRALTQS